MTAARDYGTPAEAESPERHTALWLALHGNAIHPPIYHWPLVNV